MRGTADHGWASIVVPAHEEERALRGLLADLLDQDLHGLRLEIVVVVNGSTDGTASVAREHIPRFAYDGHRLVVVELANASKAAALNAGDRHATTFPRLYLDADIRLSPNAIGRTVEALCAVRTPRLAAPRVHVEESSSVLASHYGRVWSALPYIRSRVPGVGFYAVNEAGRHRWGRFPTRIRADDKFVRLHFDSHESVVVPDASYSIFLPEKPGELVRVRGRWTSFNHELKRECPRLAQRDAPRWLPSLRVVVTRPRLWSALPGFVAVWSAGWALAQLRRFGFDTGWSRASSSPARAAYAQQVRTDQRFTTIQDFVNPNVRSGMSSQAGNRSAS